MKKAILAAAVVSLMLTACAGGNNSSDASSLSDSEALESALEEYAKVENPYAFLSDTVRLDDDYHVHEVIPDAEGYVELPKLGFRYASPVGMQTFVYECDPWHSTDQDLNPSCLASAFLTTEFFPEITDHIRLCYWTEVEVRVSTLEEYNNRVPPEMKISESEYDQFLKEDFEKTLNYISYHENNYCYDYSDSDNINGRDNSSSKDENEQPPIYGPDDKLILYVESYLGSSKKHTAPDSEQTNKKTEYIELSDDCFGYKITYDQTRYGFPMEKHVYWLYKRGQTRLHRIEFSYDKRRSEPLISDEQGLLESLELLQPTVGQEGECMQNYFGQPD